jgi:hypothetical protein
MCLVRPKSRLPVLCGPQDRARNPAPLNRDGPGRGRGVGAPDPTLGAGSFRRCWCEGPVSKRSHKTHSSLRYTRPVAVRRTVHAPTRPSTYARACTWSRATRREPRIAPKNSRRALLRTKTSRPQRKHPQNTLLTHPKGPHPNLRAHFSSNPMSLKISTLQKCFPHKISTLLFYLYS